MRNIISSKSKLSQQSSPKLLRIAQPSLSPHLPPPSLPSRHTAALRRPQSSNQPPRLNPPHFSLPPLLHFPPPRSTLTAPNPSHEPRSLHRRAATPPSNPSPAASASLAAATPLHRRISIPFSISSSPCEGKGRRCAVRLLG
ncbi:hypothetical protein Droror1_Dr00023369 [Drosera rotundifolia]